MTFVYGGLKNDHHMLYVTRIGHFDKRIIHVNSLLYHPEQRKDWPNEAAATCIMQGANSSRWNDLKDECTVLWCSQCHLSGDTVFLFPAWQMYIQPLSIIMASSVQTDDVFFIYSCEQEEEAG